MLIDYINIMGVKLVFFGSDGIFDRNDLFMWVGLLGLISFFGAELYDKIEKSIPISDWAYITIITMVLGKNTINAIFKLRTRELKNEEPC